MLLEGDAAGAERVDRHRWAEPSDIKLAAPGASRYGSMVIFAVRPHGNMRTASPMLDEFVAMTDADRRLVEWAGVDQAYDEGEVQDVALRRGFVFGRSLVLPDRLVVSLQLKCAASAEVLTVLREPPSNELLAHWRRIESGDL